MDFEEDRLYVINIPKPRILAKRSSHLIKPNDIRARRKNSHQVRKPSEVSLTKYVLPGEKPVAVSTMEKEVLLSYVQYAKKQGVNRRKQLLALNIYDKYKIIYTGLRKRLHLDDPPDDVYALTDIDKGFYKNVDGRPLHFSIPSYKSLKILFSNLLRMRQEIGYKKDAVRNLEIIHKKEHQIYEFAIKRCTYQAKYLDRFISEDYQNSMALLKKCESLKWELLTKELELHNLANEQFAIKSRLVGLDYKYSVQLKYGRFLYYLSPPMWRAQHRDFAQSIEIHEKGFDFGSSSDTDEFTVIFERMKNEYIGKMVKPPLYYTRPTDLIQVYETIQKHRLNHFAYVTSMSPHIKSLLMIKEYLKEIIAHDSTAVASTIQAFEYQIEFYAERSNQLEARFFQILNGQFYECVCSVEALKFYHHVQFCYENVFNEKLINMDLVVMAKALESFYIDYTKRLDNMQGKTVQRAIEQGQAAENLKFKRAKKAANELHLFETLEKQLLRAFAPKKKTSLIPSSSARFRSAVKKKSCKSDKKESKRDSLTEAEEEYLILFTEWKDNEDPAVYMHSFHEVEKE